MLDETDAKILTASPWRTGGDHQDGLLLHGWRLSSRTWYPITSPWMKQPTWLRIGNSGNWCLRLALVVHVRDERHGKVPAQNDVRNVLSEIEQKTRKYNFITISNWYCWE